MIIGIDGSLALSKPTGIGRYIINLVRNLAEVDDQNSYRLFYHYSRRIPKGSFYRPATGNFQTVRVRIPGKILNWWCSRFGFPRIEHFLGEVEIFHFTSVYSPWRTKKAKTVLTLHDVLPFKHPQFRPKRRSDFLRECYLKAIPTADAICVDSEDAKADLLEIFRVPESKVKVIYLGVEERFKKAAPVEPDKLRESNIDFPYILNVGVIEPRKNLAGLVEAFCLLKESKKIPHHLVVAGGEGCFYREVISQIDKSKYREQIHLLGYTPDEELPALYAAADVFVYPSFYEGFGLPVAEAMACGTPVVTSNSTSLPEVASGAAHLVDPANSEEIAWGIEKILFDTAYARTLSEKGKERAKSFDWRKTAIETLKVYQELGS